MRNNNTSLVVIMTVGVGHDCIPQHVGEFVGRVERSDMATKEKVVADALRKLSPFLMRNLNPQETAMDLYGRSMLTYLEYESIRTQNDNMKANTSLLAALRHRGEYALDELLEALKAEEAANKAVIEKINAG